MAKETQFLQLCLFLFSIWEPCLSILPDIPSDYWTPLNFKTGDILVCHIDFYASHIFLATSSSDVAHMEGNRTSRKGTLREEPWSSFHNRHNSSRKLCETFEKSTVTDAVERARRDIRGYGGREIHYHPAYCNSKHWVKDWAHGASYTYRTLDYPNSNCDVGLRNYAGAENRSTVTIYQNRFLDFSGAFSETTISVGPEECFSWTPESWWNDKASQVLLRNKCIRVWSKRDCQGHSICFCEDKIDLGYEMMDSGRSWDDEITSLSLCDYRGEIETGADLYEHLNDKGRDRRIFLQRDECITFFDGDWWNHTVSGIEVILGCLEYFNEPYCRGSSFRLAENESYVGDVYNDDINSLRPC